MVTKYEVLTAHDVAVRAKVSDRTVWRWKDEGILAYIQPSPGVVRFRASDVDALLTPKPAA